MRDNIRGKFVSDVLSISETVLMLLGSLDNITIEPLEDKKNLMQRVNKIKKYKNIDNSKILELVNSTVVNLGLVNEFVLLFESYIKETMAKNKRENLHCNNFRITLENKRDQIKLEFNKFNYKLSELIEYFLILTNHLHVEFDNKKFLDFLVKRD